jgi:alpha-tubulin suppressor-like RCC1 family protein
MSFQPCICSIIDISAGSYHNTALSSNYRITGWGNNDYLQRDFPNKVKYAYNISAGDGYSQAIVRTGINTGVINDYVRIPDGYGLFESENKIGKSTIVAGTFNFPWISTGIYNEILGFKDTTLTGACLHPIGTGGLNPQYFDSSSLIDNTVVEELIAQPSTIAKPFINIISINNLPSGLSFTGLLGPINPDIIVYAPQPSGTKIPLFGITGLYGPLFKEYQKIFYTEHQISGVSGIFATGRNDYNQSEVFNFTGIKSAIAGKNCSFVIFKNGKITGWGESLYGENLSDIHDIFTNVADISNKGSHTLVLLNTNRVSGFGLNIYNQATGGNLITGVSGIAAGLNHSLAILYNGKVTGWGDNSLGQTSGTTGFYNSWDQSPVGIINNATKISAGAYHNFICLENGTITGYGDNLFQKITKGLFLTGVVEISAGENHTIALLNNGRVTGWGSNQYGQVSGALNIAGNWESSPVGILSGVKAINTSYSHNLALLENGLVTGWGSNDYKQHFKINTFPFLTGVTKISAGNSHSIFCLPNPVFTFSETTNIPLNITGNITGFGITGSGLGITGYATINSIFVNKPTGINSLYAPTSYSITGVPKLAGNYNTYILIHELGAETEYAERYINFSILETGRFPIIFKVCGGTIGLIDQALN